MRRKTKKKDRIRTEGSGSLSAGKRRTDKLHRESRHGINNGCFDNDGYSIVELIIVIAIIALIISTVFYSVTMVFSANAKSCANAIQRAIGDCKVTTMGKSKAYMELYRDTDQNVYTKMYIWDKAAGDYTKGEPQKVGTSRVYVGYKQKGGTETELLAGSKIKIGFDRATGGFTDKGVSGLALYETIYVVGGSKNYEITLTEITGKSEVVVK